MCVGGLVCSVLADLIAGVKNYRSIKMDIIAYIVYSFGQMGTYLVYFADPKGWAATMLQNGTTQEYITAMNDAAAWRTLIVMVAGQKGKPIYFDPRTKIILLILSMIVAAIASSLAYECVLILLIAGMGILCGKMRYSLIGAVVFFLLYLFAVFYLQNIT